jgi:DNA-binding response OmpR family regulator
VARVAMVVEDEALIAMSLEEGLSDLGFVVAGPFSACSDAIDFLRSETPHVAILDSVLSDGLCIELARELRHRGVPFLVYSGAAALTEYSPDFEGVQFIEKPADTRFVVEAAVGLCSGGG